MRIDAHVHLWNLASDPQDWIDPVAMAPIARDFDSADLGEMLAECGMEKAVVVQASNSVEESVRLARSDASVVAGLVAWVDLTGDVPAQLQRIRSQATVPVVGVRHLAHVDPDPEWLLRADVGRGLVALEAAGLSFDLVVRDWQLGQVRTLAARHEGLEFVLDHLGGPPAPGNDAGEWASAFRAVAARANVVAKVSGVNSGLEPGWAAEDVRPLVEVALDAFGPARLLYGSDWPLARLGGGAQAWRSALETLVDGLSEQERDGFFGGNAAAVYSLG